MPAPRRLSQLPEAKDLKEELLAICRQPRGYVIAEKGMRLMGLDVVRDRVEPDSKYGELDYAEAVRVYLHDAVSRLSPPHQRVLLQVVLGLDDERWRTVEWRNKTLGERQIEAGMQFRQPDSVAKQATIRAHQPKAVETLVAIILDDERARRSHPPKR
ncbi:MAG: hypothetical protein ACLP50_33280 [Solirubrobacteraceae bacterium]